MQYSASQVDQAVNLIYQSGVDEFNYLFLSHAKAFIAYCFTKTYNIFSYKEHVIIQQETDIIATMGFCAGKRAYLLHIVTLYYIFNFFSFRAALSVLYRCMRIKTVWKMPCINGFYISNLCTHKQFRKKRIATELIQEKILFTQQINTPLYLDVRADNQACRLYEKLNFKSVYIKEPSISLSKQGISKTIRMMHS